MSAELFHFLYPGPSDLEGDLNALGFSRLSEDDEGFKRAQIMAKEVLYLPQVNVSPHFVFADGKITLISFRLTDQTFGRMMVYDPFFCIWMEPENDKDTEIMPILLTPPGDYDRNPTLRVLILYDLEIFGSRKFLKEIFFTHTLGTMKNELSFNYYSYVNGVDMYAAWNMANGRLTDLSVGLGGMSIKTIIDDMYFFSNGVDDILEKLGLVPQFEEGSGNQYYRVLTSLEPGDNPALPVRLSDEQIRAIKAITETNSVLDIIIAIRENPSIIKELLALRKSINVYRFNSAKLRESS